MTQNKNFLMQEVAGKQVVVPVGTAAVDFPGMITLNETGAELWKMLETEQTEETLLAAILEQYDVTAEVAKADIAAFVERLQKVGAIVG